MSQQIQPYITQFDQSQRLKAKSHRLIPGGAHTYAKGDDQYPELAPGFLVKGKGCHVWDVDGNEYIEFGMGLRAVTLGHAYASVIEAAHHQMLQGINFTRPSTLEIDCAEAFLSLIKGADMVKFAKNGSDVTTAAVKLARAYTGRNRVAICGSHPFFSVDDWFIGSTPMSAGIPEAIQALTVKFQYNDLPSVQALFEQYPGEIAGLMMEAETTEPPQPGFLEGVQQLCAQYGAIFILDEIITGFRWHRGGAQAVHGITPDLSTFGKALGNGFAIAALAGKREIMERGGLDHDQERVFLLSTTFGAEHHALAAAMEVMRIYTQEPVIEHLARQGERLRHGIQQAVAALGLSGYFGVMGRPCNLIYFTCNQNKVRSQPFRTLFLQETIKRGVIMPSLVVSYSHSDADIDHTIEAISEALVIYRRALEEGVDKYLTGRPVKPVFRTFN
ncbi:glutamate-1-semialdehyde 2,1-aminomutase [Synechococcales cyanobacterium C]|uniref:Glutamate-1-semialdehyde 2,1-aminomutase n=1 Tax=Petrachloros mirabilis ULC683 TaxID=2781853 RepID=A0A8K2A6Q2_9CYAN|nr:glutamate-1-semialdehyde 2,1-aminomutase [Petrachloros mirabilis]NCJ05410.1 glutamate-1-semialdehyde 2,1-aminomutase [Petrachloros mirabilis ULC683]